MCALHITFISPHSLTIISKSLFIQSFSFLLRYNIVAFAPEENLLLQNKTTLRMLFIVKKKFTMHKNKLFCRIFASFVNFSDYLIKHINIAFVLCSLYCIIINNKINSLNQSSSIRYFVTFIMLRVYISSALFQKRILSTRLMLLLYVAQK